MNKIYNGDCLEIVKTLNEKVHLVLTDPPYELGSFRNHIGEWEKREMTKTNIFKDLNSLLVDGGHIMCFSANRTIHKFATAIEEANFEIRDTLIWKYKQSIPRNMDIAKAIDSQTLYGKTSSKYLKKVEQEYGGKEYVVRGTSNTMFGEKKEFIRKEYSPITSQAKEWEGWGTNLAPSYEPIIMGRKKFNGSLANNIIEKGRGALNIQALTELNGKFPCNVLEFEKEKKDSFNNHPMVKPVKLLEYIILMTTKEGDLVLDPFMGSGSTMVACANTNRRYIGIEKEKDYFNIVKQRLDNINSIYSIFE